jgi:tripartite-type tricarboxylate transporter receptor subunit TctC
VKERLFGMGMEVIPGSPDEFAATIRHEMAKWGKLIREARLRE